MSLQICPRCKVKNFIWHIDEEVSKLTQWLCDSCGYRAEEDETLIQDCPRCHAKRVYSLLSDASGNHRWCAFCGVFEPAEALPGDSRP